MEYFSCSCGRLQGYGQMNPMNPLRCEHCGGVAVRKDIETAQQSVKPTPKKRRVSHGKHVSKSNSVLQK